MNETTIFCHKRKRYICSRSATKPKWAYNVICAKTTTNYCRSSKSSIVLDLPNLQHFWSSKPPSTYVSLQNFPLLLWVYLKMQNTVSWTAPDGKCFVLVQSRELCGYEASGHHQYFQLKVHPLQQLQGCNTYKSNYLNNRFKTIILFPNYCCQYINETEHKDHVRSWYHQV